MILDTNFLIDIDNNRPDAIKKAQQIERAGRPRRVPRIVMFELWVAVGKGTHTEHNRQKFERLLDGLPQVELTATIAKRLQTNPRGVEAVGRDSSRRGGRVTDEPSWG